MSNSRSSLETVWKGFARVLVTGLKLAILAAAVGFAVYHFRFAPVAVESRPAVVGPIVSEVMGTGTLEARVSTSISPRVAGTITQVLVDQGDRIVKGQTLVTLYDKDLQQQVKIAQAELEAIRAGIERAGADIATCEPVAVQARTNYGRVSKLFSQKVISSADLDAAIQQRDVAEAQLKRARLAKVEIEQQARKAEESLRYHRERLADTSITSPFDGLVVSRRRDPGDVVVPGGEILQIISTDQLWVSAWVDETVIASVSANQDVRVVFRSDPGTSYHGKVTRIAPTIDRETREFLVDVTVRDIPSSWAVGQRAEVYIQTAGKQDAVLVPPQAISWRDTQAGLFVERAGRATWQAVTVGLRGADHVEIVQGLTPGDIVLWPADSKSGTLTEGRAVVRGGVS